MSVQQVLTETMELPGLTARLVFKELREQKATKEFRVRKVRLDITAYPARMVRLEAQALLEQPEQTEQLVQQEQQEQLVKSAQLVQLVQLGLKVLLAMTEHKEHKEHKGRKENKEHKVLQG
jgi:hypothetical protein